MRATPKIEMGRRLVAWSSPTRRRRSRRRDTTGPSLAVVARRRRRRSRRARRWRRSPRPLTVCHIHVAGGLHRPRRPRRRGFGRRRLGRLVGRSPTRSPRKPSLRARRGCVPTVTVETVRTSPSRRTTTGDGRRRRGRRRAGRTSSGSSTSRARRCSRSRRRRWMPAASAAPPVDARSAMPHRGAGPPSSLRRARCRPGTPTNANTTTNSTNAWRKCIDRAGRHHERRASGTTAAGRCGARRRGRPRRGCSSR